jgi:hypothetical protein
VAVPDRFVGVWRRRDLVIGDEPRDDADVLWLQAGEWYADLRIPHEDEGGPVEAFAGPAGWAAPNFTWTHVLDWKGTFPSDVGHMEPVAEGFVETGTFDLGAGPTPYRELWARSGRAEPRLVAVAHDGAGAAALVRVGRHALTMVSGPGGAFAACRQDRGDDGTWRVVFSRACGVPPIEPLDPDAVTETGERAVSIAVGGRTLDVLERRSEP